MKKVAHHSLFVGRTASHERKFYVAPHAFLHAPQLRLQAVERSHGCARYGTIKPREVPPLDRAHRPARVSRARPLDYRVGRLGRGGGECPRMADAARLTNLNVHTG